MIKNQNPNKKLRITLLALLTISLICIVISLTIRLTDRNEAKKIPVEQLLQQYWLDQYAQSARAAQNHEAVKELDTGPEEDKRNHSDPINGANIMKDNASETEANSTSADTDKQNVDSKIDINTASVEQLQQLKGIGPSKAQAIVEDRERKGKFKRIEDIKRVKGIGEKLFAGIQESIVATQ